MDGADRVLERATERAAALANADASGLEALLHAAFRWTSHTGQEFDRDSYVRANTGGGTVWRAQTLSEPEIVVVGGTAVLTCTVLDEIEEAGARQVFKMRMTQVWVRERGSWTCLAGHAGPRISPR